MPNHKQLINWVSINVRDLETAARFYSDLLGRPVQKIPPANHRLGDHPRFLLTHAAGGPDNDAAEAVFGGELNLVKEPGDLGGRGVTIFFGVDAVPEALDRAWKAGGKVVQPLTDLGKAGWFGIVADPDGNVIGIHAEKA